MMGVVRRDLLKEVCRRLLRYDPDIVEIVQFGSSVYAPQHARDVDLLVITRKAKGYGGYLDAANAEDIPFDVDVIVVELGEELGKELLRGILGAFEVIHGTGKLMLRYAKALGDPTFKEARTALRAARDYIELAERTSDALLRDRHVREAFDSLFHAARIAAMTYLSTEVSRWGLVRRMLPGPYRKRFEKLMDILHVEYFYNGNYPKDRVKGEFERWLREVDKFINELERETRRKRPA